MKKIYIAALLSLTCQYALADTAPAPQEGVKNEMFQKHKAHESQSHQDRIGILQTADTCVKNASTREQFRACEESERNSRKELKASNKEFREEMRSERSEMRNKMQEKREERRSDREQRRSGSAN